MHEVTQILNAIDQGDPQAAEQLLPLVYEELRKLAAQKLAQINRDRRCKPQLWSTKRTFGSSIANISNHGTVAGISLPLRRKPCEGFLLTTPAAKAVSSEAEVLRRLRLEELLIPAKEISDDVLDLDEALTKLSSIDFKSAELVKLRYFTGLTIPQAAEILGVSRRTADSLWAYARAWLFDELRERC